MDAVARGQLYPQCPECSNVRVDCWADCTDCRGAAQLSFPCLDCGGTAYVRPEPKDGKKAKPEKCSSCEGTGWKTEDCERCTGHGVLIVPTLYAERYCCQACGHEWRPEDF